MKKYFIKDNYHHRKSIEYFDDTSNTDNWQREIYEYAKKMSVGKKYKKVLDVGCGSGFKLMKYFNEFETCGFDLPKTIQFLEKKYPNGRWESHELTEEIKEPFDLVLCVDVIEHILDPDVLMNFIKNIDFKTAIISTPERDICRGVNTIGPPENGCHVREWNKAEFNSYITSHVDIKEHHVVAKFDQFVVIEK